MKVTGARDYLPEALQHSEGTEEPRRLDALFKSLPWAAARRRARRARADMLFSPDSYLETTGWLRSRRAKAAVDKSGKPVPWMTYASVQFMSERINREMLVFEFGSGASTLWWAERVRAVISCECDTTWYKRIAAMVPGNVVLMHAPERGTYARQILSCKDRFDIVVIDGECRDECARTCVGALKPEGIVVWDNSDRTKWQDGYDFLGSLDFRRIDFSSLGPINVDAWTTSIFYRPHNCLGI